MLSDARLDMELVTVTGAGGTAKHSRMGSVHDVPGTFSCVNLPACGVLTRQSDGKILVEEHRHRRNGVVLHAH